MLMEVVSPEPLTGDHVPFRKETGKSEFMEGERGVVVEKGTLSPLLYYDLTIPC
jgi:hypothetical protein